MYECMLGALASSGLASADYDLDLVTVLLLYRRFSYGICLIHMMILCPLPSHSPPVFVYG